MFLSTEFGPFVDQPSLTSSIRLMRRSNACQRPSTQTLQKFGVVTTRMRQPSLVGLYVVVFFSDQLRGDISKTVRARKKEEAWPHVGKAPMKLSELSNLPHSSARVPVFENKSDAYSSDEPNSIISALHSCAVPSSALGKRRNESVCSPPLREMFR